MATQSTAIEKTVIQHNGCVFHLRRVKDPIQSSPSTLVLLWGFFGATKDAISKYSQIYHVRGFDVLYIQSAFKHFAWPKTSIHLSQSVLSYLQSHLSSYERFLVHAFSMGAYNFTICLHTMNTNKDFWGIRDKISCVVYDSLTIGSLEQMSWGLSLGLSKKAAAQLAIYYSAMAYFNLTYPFTVTVHNFHINNFVVKPLEKPTMFFMSKNDPLSDWKFITKIIAELEENFTMPVARKCWDKSKHAAHILEHKEEYLQALNSFIDIYIEKVSKL